MSSLRISIHRESLSLTPLILTGHADVDAVLSVSNYREPAMQPRINYAPTTDQHGDMPLGWSYQEALLSFTVFPVSTTETDARAKIATLVAAVSRLTYSVHITVNDAADEQWTCRPGTVVPIDDRTFTDMKTFDAEWAVTIPAYPIRSI